MDGRVRSLTRSSDSNAAQARNAVEVAVEREDSKAVSDCGRQSKDRWRLPACQHGRARRKRVRTLVPRRGRSAAAQARTVEQLRRSDHRHGALLAGDENVFQVDALSLGRDEDRRVDQDGQACCGLTVTEPRERTSSAKRSSATGRRLTGSSTKAPLRNECDGRLMTATRWPWRSISIVSPAAARLRTCPKS